MKIIKNVEIKNKYIIYILNHITMNKIIPVIKKYVGYWFIYGFSYGAIIPNEITITKYKNEHKKFQCSSKNIIIPFITGAIGVCGFLCFPLFFTNYLIGGTYLDKLYDRIQEKYLIKIKRYHQYDGNENKYAYPSIIHIDINENVKN